MIEKTGSQSEATEWLAERANHDSFTGLPDRVLLLDRLEAAIAQAQRGEDFVALLVVDLNRRTEVRATLGLDGGEELTRMVARRLEGFARKSHTLAYIGSDLFALVMPCVGDLPQILGLTSQLLKLFDGPWEIAGQSLHLTPGVGIAYYPEDGAVPGLLLAGAVTAASHAAMQGDLRPHLCDPAWNLEARQRFALEADLRRALERDELLLHYQPLVNAGAGCISGFEALVRWQHPESGLLQPNDFIPVAEATHLILPIGAWVVEEACRQLAAWRDQGYPGVRVAVNLAAAQLADKGFTATVRAAIQRHGLDPGQLEVEITESTAIANEARTARVLERLKTLGMRVTLDDFGTGYSSVLLLVQYPFDTLKIDRSFVARVQEGEKVQAVAAAMIALAHAGGMTVVAEGVETREQLTLLKELGADEIQGFFFSRPLPAAECTAFLAGRCDLAQGGTG